MIATFAGRWRAAVAAAPDRPFLLWEGPDERVTTWTYGEFDALVERTAARLVREGAAPGSAVHLLLANSPAFVATWLAAMRLGAWIVPADPSARVHELCDQFQRTRPAVIVAGSDRAATAIAARDQVHASGRVVAVAEDDTELAEFAPAGAAPVAHPLPRADTRAAVMFTSGTTSRPKGVEITQANYAFAGDVMAAGAALKADDRCLVVLPLFHANAQYYSFAAAISAGASVALVPAFSASRFLAQAARLEATAASLFAAPMRMILAKDPAPEPSIRLRHCWFAQNVSDDQYERLATLLGCRPRQLYGMTETLPAVLTDRAIDPVPSTMGFPTLGCRLELQDEVGAPVADGEVGEIVVGGTRGVELLRGYLDDPETTARSFRDGWFRTGDRAVVTGDGRWRFVGRGADVLKVAGENVSAVEIEAVLSAHPDVLEAAVIAQPDEMRDEVPVAFVVKAPQRDSLDIDALAAWADQQLAKSKRPQRYVVIDELPRTSVGKIRKFQLKDQL
jgi:crotonobetaine/carnitine-CoA ligase